MRKKFTTLNGYILEYKPDHPNAIASDNYKGYVYQHRLVMEQEIGRFLQPYEDVHHLNGSRSDNSPKNLILLKDSHHTRLHNWMNNNVIIPIEKDKHFCVTCGAEIFSKRGKFCSTCAPSNNRVFDINNIDQVSLGKDLITHKSLESIGKKYNVTGNSVKKWCKKLGLPDSIKETN